MPASFDSKFFNAEIFGGYRDSIPDPTLNAILTSGAVTEDASLGAMFQDEGGNYAVMPMIGTLGGVADNYDGVQNITLDSLSTYMQGMIVMGRAHGWTEKDFATDLTRVDWMEVIAQKVNGYMAKVNMADIYAILAGIFGVTAGGFNAAHTLDVSSTGDGKISATSLNDGIQKAMGDQMNAFSLAFMDSFMATKLKNMNLLEYVKATDSNGLQRDTGLATWGGRSVIVDDSVPTVTGAGGAGAHQIIVLGNGAIRHASAPVKVPNEMSRDSLTNGGKDILIARMRNLWQPYGLSFTRASMASLSPTTAELATAANWTLVNNGAAEDTEYIDHKVIPIGRIIAKG